MSLSCLHSRSVLQFWLKRAFSDRVSDFLVIVLRAAMSGRNLSGIRRQRRIDEGEDERAAKLQRVLHTKNTSASALAAIIADIEGVNHSRKYLQSVGEARFSVMSTALVLPKEGGGEVRVELCDPSQLMFRLVSESEELQALFEAALLSSPNSAATPWSLLVGWDEYSPGNKLKVLAASRPSLSGVAPHQERTKLIGPRCWPLQGGQRSKSHGAEFQLRGAG